MQAAVAPFFARANLARMIHNVLWSADDTGYAVHVRFGIRTVRQFRAECLAGETLAEVRMQAAAKAVELALQYRIDLAQVRETSDPL